LIMNAPKRIFIALLISESLQREILNWEKSNLKLKNLPVRWIAGKNLHLTLVSPWLETDIESVFGKLRDIVKGFKPFEIEFVKVCFGPNKNNPRLIWAEGASCDNLASLKEKLENIFGVKNENRPWLPHLTLARFKPKDFAAFSIKKLDEKVSWKEFVDNVAIMESKLSSSGTEYEIMREVKLC